MLDNTFHDSNSVYISDSKYPFEPPYFYFYKLNGEFPSLDCLRICRKLYNEALKLCEYGSPYIFSIVSLFENEHEMKLYLKENKEHFLDEMSYLFPKLSSEENDMPSHYKTSGKRKEKPKEITEETIKINLEIQSIFLNKQNNLQYCKMKQVRKKLPAWTMMGDILNIIQENSVSIISGETGCGKSTQVFLFIHGKPKFLPISRFKLIFPLNIIVPYCTHSFNKLCAGTAIYP